MFIAEKPYISEIFKKTVSDHKIPVIDTEAARDLCLFSDTVMITEKAAVESIKNGYSSPLYTNSENSIKWVCENLPFSQYPDMINIYKDKALFRELTKKMYPDFFFQKLFITDLDTIAIETIPMPFIIKPNVGFFSLGVYRVTSSEKWEETVASIKAQAQHIQTLYPAEVLDAGTLIIEECIDGDEFAIDCYLDSKGKPVVLNILKHFFATEMDTNDRIYMTSKEIIENNLEEFTEFAGKMGELAKAKTFPLHIEVRRKADGTLMPIEVNPMRFGGWCTTADTCYHAYGLNPYLYYYEQRRPDWAAILKDKAGKLFSLVVLDNSTGWPSEEIASFDYDKLLLCFEKVYELRKADYREFPVFGFLFVETRAENEMELRNILKSDLREFVKLKGNF